MTVAPLATYARGPVWMAVTRGSGRRWLLVVAHEQLQSICGSHGLGVASALGKKHNPSATERRFVSSPRGALSAGP